MIMRARRRRVSVGVVKDTRSPQRVVGEADKPVPAAFAGFCEGRRVGRNASR
jgi:hypothetical protein